MMFGLRKKVTKIDKIEMKFEHKISMQERTIAAEQAYAVRTTERVKQLEHQVVELVQALEWHVGSNLEIIVAEEKIIKLKLAERRQRLAENGEAGTVQEQMEGMVVHGEEPEDVRDKGCS